MKCKVQFGFDVDGVFDANDREYYEAAIANMVRNRDK